MGACAETEKEKVLQCPHTPRLGRAKPDPCLYSFVAHRVGDAIRSLTYFGSLGLRKGNPKFRSNALPSVSFVAVVTMVISIP